jgi:polysaccharide biosynthesis protein PslG
MIRALCLALLVALCVAAPAQASKKPVVGFGEQNSLIFADERWVDLDRPDVRYVMSWDALRFKRDALEVKFFMDAAKATNARVLLSFGHSRRPGRELKMPTPAQFTAQFRKFRRLYPWVKTFQAWNEANHGSQPTYRRPELAARVFDIVKRRCRSCTVTAPSVLDDGWKTIRWIQAFRAAAKHKVTIWSLHNHIDANRHRLGNASTTKLFLRYTRGQVWFTETGGIWNRWVPDDRGHKRRVTMYTHVTAVRAVRNIFKLQRLNPRRIKRIYVYNWFAPGEKKPRWDSGLIGPNGKERPTYRTLLAQIRKYGL